VIGSGPGRRSVAEGLELDGVTVRYDAVAALDRVTMEVEAGEVVAVVGPSGSGKSTLLRAVAGLEPLAEGRVLVGGRDLAGVPTHHRGLGLMFQDHGLFTHLDVAANIAYGLKVAGVAKRQRLARVAELLELVGLQGMGSRRIDQLSGGEAQRVALARALAPEPGLLMLDEPLGSLDRALREQLVGELKGLLTELDQTALHVTHDQAEAFALADRVAVIDRGRVVAHGRPAELWADPGTRFVASFLGHPNIWTVTLDADGGVRAGGIDLGVLAAGHPLRASGPGPMDVVVPVAAVREGFDGGAAVEAMVEHVVFDRGAHRVTARLIGCATARSGPGEGADGPTTTFDTDVAHRLGDRCTLSIEIDGMRRLED
jgi:thiamine transport system ATP-binding protein